MEKIIDLTKLLSNVENLKKLTRAKFCAVVKCDAYGHGANKIALKLDDVVDSFAVANIAEAMELVCCGIKKDILILSDLYKRGDYPDNVLFTAFDNDSLRTLIVSGRKFFVKLDTGMNRLGFLPEEFMKVLEIIGQERLAGVYSHIRDTSSVDYQVAYFEKATSFLNCEKHIFAGNFCLFKDYCHYDAVRCGLPLYGYGVDCVKPIMSVSANILEVKKVSAGKFVGYGNNKLPYDCYVATVQVGYGDGFRRKLPGENRTVVIGNERCSVIGQICMDACMVRIPEWLITEKTAWLICDEFTAEDSAMEQNTIPYEILTSYALTRGVTKYIN